MVVLPCPGRSAGGEFASGVRRIRRCVVPSCVSCAGRAACTSVLPFLASNLIRFGMWLRHVCTCTYYLPKYRMYRTYRTCFQAPRTLRRLHMGRRRHTSTHVRHVLSPDICPLAIRPAHRCAPGSCAPLSRDPAILTGATAPRSRVTPATLPMLRTHHAMIPQRHAILARARCDGDAHTPSAQHCGYVHSGGRAAVNRLRPSPYHMYVRTCLSSRWASYGTILFAYAPLNPSLFRAPAGVPCNAQRTSAPILLTIHLHPQNSELNPPSTRP